MNSSISTEDKTNQNFIHQYWCTFKDDTQKEICTVMNLISYPDQPEPKAILLPETDERVQDFLNPKEGRNLQLLRLNSMDDFYRLADYFDKMLPSNIFRGQNNYEWNLKTQLELDTDEFVLSDVGLEQYEYRILCEAQRRFHNFFTQLPSENDRLSWLALLRHHGVPTRLLDVTRSLYIACYFALRDVKPNTDAAIWIFSRHKMDGAFFNWNHKADETWFKHPFTIATHNEPYYWPFPKDLKIDYEAPTIDKIKDKNSNFLNFTATLDAAMRGYINKPGMAIVEPFWLSRRIDFQQGAFLVPFNVRYSFQENLFSFLKLSTSKSDELSLMANFEDFSRFWYETKVLKVRIPSFLHAGLKKKLDTMNIRDITLFPDLDGGISHLKELVPRQNRNN